MVCGKYHSLLLVICALWNKVQDLYGGVLNCATSKLDIHGENVVYTLFAQSDAVATIYFIMQFCVASIQEQLLFKSGVY